MNRSVLVILVVLSAGVGCGEWHARARQQAESQGDPQVSAVPSDVSFTIVNNETVLGIKRSLDVRLSRKVSEATLRSIALELKSRGSLSYERTFITYYLPGMKVGGGAWATTHFDPELELKILGLSAEDEHVADGPEPDGRDVIGRWLDQSPVIGGRITIFRQGGRSFIEQQFKDGSSRKKELTETRTPHGRRFDRAEGSQFGDHWILDSGGNLQIRDAEGLIATAIKVE